jgi:hypothetical protein
MQIYKQGLKDKVRIKLIRLGTTINTLNQLIKESVRLNNELYKFKLESKAFQPREEKNYNLLRKANYGQAQQLYAPKTYEYYQSRGPKLIHLNII